VAIISVRSSHGRFGSLARVQASPAGPGGRLLVAPGFPRLACTPLARSPCRSCQLLGWPSATLRRSRTLRLSAALCAANNPTRIERALETTGPPLGAGYRRSAVVRLMCRLRQPTRASPFYSLQPLAAALCAAMAPGPCGHQV
jgi:hypothetical protein